MDKEDVVHIYNGTLFSHNKLWNNAIWGNMDGFRDYHTTEVYLDKDKYHISFICDTLEKSYKWTYI